MQVADDTEQGIVWTNDNQWLILLTWFNFNRSNDK